jgi:hypothetical protein
MASPGYSFNVPSRCVSLLCQPLVVFSLAGFCLRDGSRYVLYILMHGLAADFLRCEMSSVLPFLSAASRMLHFLHSRSLSKPSRFWKIMTVYALTSWDVANSLE